jgi:hypothetical protein
MFIKIVMMLIDLEIFYLYFIMQIEQYLFKIPDELLAIIYSFLPNKIKMKISRKIYLENHYILKPILLNKNCFESYVRNIIRRDHNFVFERVFNENVNSWLSKKNVEYNYCIYANYLHFLRSFCMEQESTRCKTIIDNYLKKGGMSINQHKKFIIKNIRSRWKI